MVALAQKVATGAETKATLPQSHACAASLGRSGALTVLQMGQMRSVTIRDELQQGKDKDEASRMRTDLLVNTVMLFVLSLTFSLSQNLGQNGVPGFCCKTITATRAIRVTI